MSSFTTSLNYNQLQELTINLQRNPSSLTAEDQLQLQLQLQLHSRSTTDFSSSRASTVTGQVRFTNDLPFTTALTADFSTNEPRFTNRLRSVVIKALCCKPEGREFKSR
jgi:hypothetical protein